jgi:hypothetical protein
MVGNCKILVKPLIRLKLNYKLENHLLKRWFSVFLAVLVMSNSSLVVFNGSDVDE